MASTLFLKAGVVGKEININEFYLCKCNWKRGVLSLSSLSDNYLFLPLANTDELYGTEPRAEI